MSGYRNDPLQFINLIADNLRDRYSPRSILKEIIQNTDDAGDKKSIRLEFGISQGIASAAHPLLRGPGLFFWNNGSFTSTDDLAIRSFGLNHKAAEKGAIGKFGLGMKSVFHLCEAFFYLARGEGKSYCRILNPWIGDEDASDARHLDWERFDDQEGGRIRDHLAPILTPLLSRNDAWFLLWLPLRQERHLDGGGAIVSMFPGDDPEQLRFLSAPDLPLRLAELLPFLKRLDTIRFWKESRPGRFEPQFQVTLEPESSRLLGPGNLHPGARRPMAGATTAGRFSGIEILADAPFRDLHHSDLWPSSYVRDAKGRERKEKDKADAHAAVAFARRSQVGAKGRLRIRWAVFLPLEDSEESLPCPGGHDYLLTLHGFFFVDAGRKGIEGMREGVLPKEAAHKPTTESDVRQQWNARLGREVVLPLVLPALERFVEETALSATETEELCQALKKSRLWQCYRREICAGQRYVQELTRSGPVWRLLASTTPVLSLPGPPTEDPALPWTVFPALDAPSRLQVVVNNDASALTADPLPDWHDGVLTTLLLDVAPATFRHPPAFAYLVRVFDNRIMRPHLVADDLHPAVRHILARILAAPDDLTRHHRETIKRIISRVRPARRRSAPRIPEPLRDLLALDLQVLLVPQEYEPDHSQGTAIPSARDVERILERLHRHLASDAEKTVQQAGLDLAQDMLQALPESQRYEVLLRRRHALVIQAYDCRRRQRRAVSFHELEKAQKDGLLFRYGAGSGEEERLACAPLLQAVIEGKVFVLNENMVKLLFGAEAAKRIVPCTETASLHALGQGNRRLASPPVHRDVLLKRLAGTSPDTVEQRRGMRYLLHGDPRHVEDTETTLWVRGTEVATVWEKVWRRLQPQANRDGWNLISRDLAKLLPQILWPALGLREIHSKHICEELEKKGPAMLHDVPFSSDERFEILATMAETRGEAGWRALPLHTTIHGRQVAAQGNDVYLHDGTNLPAELAERVDFLAPAPEERCQKYQNRWLRPIKAHDIARLALNHDAPVHFWELIMEVLAAEEEAHLPPLCDKLRDHAWLPLQGGGAVKPEDVLLLPEIEEELDRLVSRERGSFQTSGQLDGAVRSHPAYEKLQQLFAQGQEGIERLALLLEEQAAYRLGNLAFDDDNDEDTNRILDQLAKAPDTLHLPGWSLVHKLWEAYGHEPVRRHLFPVLLQQIEAHRLHGLLQWLVEEHERQGIRNKKWLKTLYDRLLAAFVSAPDAKECLPRLLLYSRTGHWHGPEKLCTGVEGIADRHLLDDEQARVLDRIVVAGGGGCRAGRPSGENQEEWHRSWPELQPALEHTARLLQEVFDPWKGRLAEEIIGCFLALLGGDPGVQRLVEGYRGNRSRRWFLDHLPWKVVRRLDEYGRTYWCSGLSANEAVDRLRCVVEVVEGDRQVIVTSLTGTPLTVDQDPEAETLLIGRPGWYALTSAPRPDMEVVRIRLRRPDPDRWSESRLTSALRNTAESLLVSLYEQQEIDLKELWERLDSSEQLDLRVAERLIMEHVPFYLRQIGADKGCEALRKELQQLHDIRRGCVELACRGDGDDRDIRRQEKEKQQCLDRIRELLANDAGVQAATLAAIQNKMRDFQYEPASIPFELFQNADDAVTEQAEIEAVQAGVAERDVEPPSRQRCFVTFAAQDRLSFVHWGRAINSTGGGAFRERGIARGYHQDLEKMLILSASDKSAAKVTGKFGLGFKSVFLVCRRPRVVSGRLGFEVAAGIYPALLTEQETLRQRLAAAAPGFRRPGTIVDLPLDDGVAADRVLERFRDLAGPLVIFARNIRRIVLRDAQGAVDSSMSWDPEVLLDSGICRVESGRIAGGRHREETEAVYFRCGHAGLLLGFGPQGCRGLPDHIPAVWVVAPTRETAGLGLAVNGDFALDAGRARLSGNTAANRDEARRLGRDLAAGFTSLFDATEQDWPGFVQRARLEEDLPSHAFWYSLWRVLGQALDKSGSVNSEQPSTSTLLHDILTGDGGLGGFLRAGNRAAIPTGLWGAYAVMTREERVRYEVNGILESQEVFAAVAGLAEFQSQVAPGEIIDHHTCTLSCRFQRRHGSPWPALRLEQVVRWAVGKEGQVLPETAGRLAEVIEVVAREVEKRPSHAPSSEWTDEYERLRKAILHGCRFKSAAGSWEAANRLLVGHDEKGTGEEGARASFAPPARLLSSEYDPTGIRFFNCCREQMSAPVEDMAAWVRDAADNERRRAALRYLRDGERKLLVLERLRENGLEGTWLAELRHDSPYLAGWSEHDRDELLLRQLRSHEELRDTHTAAAPAKSGSNPFGSLDPSEELPRIAAWWRQQRSMLLQEYNTRRFPSDYSPDGLSLDERGAADRSAWLTLFILGRCHTMGRTKDEQHRGYLELCRDAGWWDVFCAAPGETEAADWLRVLDDFFDRYDDEEEYQHWESLFPVIYGLARNLDTYATFFLDLPRLLPHRTLQDLLAPRATAMFQGGGIDLPPMRRMFGMGMLFIIRELVRAGRLPASPQIVPYCYVPVGRVRELLHRMGAKLGNDRNNHNHHIEQSRRIHRFLVNHLGEEEALFGGDFDIPLMLWAEKQYPTTDMDERERLRCAAYELGWLDIGQYAGEEMRSATTPPDHPGGWDEDDLRRLGLQTLLQDIEGDW